MENLPSEPGKLSNHHYRIWNFILGFFLLAVLILIPLSASFAQSNAKLGVNQNSNSEYSNSIIQQSVVLTDTATITPSLTSTFEPTLTETPTATPTSTETATPTATQTETATPTPTQSGTPPTATLTRTPTVTGTATGIPSLKVAVTPTQAKVNETFTFTIEVGNTGSLPTENNIVLDSFPTFIDVQTVTTNKGTVTKLTHNFVVTVGEIGPAEKVTIIAIVKVNSTLTRTETLTNVVTLTYDVAKSMTASVTYRVLFQALPPTGDLPLNWREARSTPIGLIPGILLFALGIILLAIGIWSRANDRKNMLWMVSIGALLIIVGFVVGLTASGILVPNQQSKINNSPPTSAAIIAQIQPAEQSVLPRLPAAAFSTPEGALPIVTLPNYPIPTPVISYTPQPGVAEPDTSPVVRIAIPSLFLDTIVKYVPYDGYSWMISGLREEIAWMGNTSWPGLGSNTALAGHVTVAGMGDGPFRHLEELPIGEIVILYTERNMYTYTIRESRVTDDSDMAVTSPTSNSQVTLITCVNWDEQLRTYANRLVVIGDLVRTEPITAGSAP